MQSRFYSLAALLVLGGTAPAIRDESVAAATPPKPYGPAPSGEQLAWQELEFYGFCHFGINTFAGEGGSEWSEGKAPAEKGVNDGKGFCFISHVGDVYPSGFLQICGGNVRETTLSAIYRDSDLFRSLRDPSLLQGKCGRCEFKDVCGGSRARAWATSGSHLAEEPCCTYQPGSAA